MQGSGQRLLVLEPVEGCSINCTRVSVLLKPRDFCKFLIILEACNILIRHVQLFCLNNIRYVRFPSFIIIFKSFVFSVLQQLVLSTQKHSCCK
jgi:hypothetical protein